MKFKFIAILYLITPIALAEIIRKDVQVIEVGLSLNTQRVFIKAIPAATNTSCVDLSHYAMELGTPESYLFYSAALSSINEGKKMRIQYEPGKCIGGAPIVDVFWNLST